MSKPPPTPPVGLAITAATIALSAVAILVGCTQAGGAAPDAAVPTPTATSAPSPTPSPTPTPWPTPTPTPDADGSSSRSDEPVTFTYECWVESPGAGNSSGTTAPFVSWAETWQDPRVSSCLAVKHGTVVTERQRRAVDLAIEAYGGDREYALEGLHVQCAITDNGYLRLDWLSGNQVHEVAGMLELCPDRPGADKLRAALANS